MTCKSRSRSNGGRGAIRAARIVLERIFSKFLFNRSRGKIGENVVVMASDDLQGAFGEGGGVGGGHLQGGFAVFGDVSEALLLGQVALVR